MGTTYMIGVKKIALSKLRKLEVHSFYKEVMRVIEDFDTKAMHIGETCDVLAGMKAKNDLLKRTDKDLGPHILTPKINELHERRLKFAAIITNVMRTEEKADFAERRHLVELAKPIVFSNLNYLRQNDKAAIEEYIKELFYHLEQNLATKSALYELGFKPYLDELEAANNEYIETYLERNRQLSQRPKGSTRPVQRELLYIIDVLFNQVNHYQHLFKDIDYTGMISGLNYVIATYTKLIKTRDTQRKNKKLKAEDNAQAPLKEELRMEKIENGQFATVSETTASDESTPDIEGKQKENPPVMIKKTEGKEKPIGGLLDILKKMDEEKNEGDEDDK